MLDEKNIWSECFNAKEVSKDPFSCISWFSSGFVLRFEQGCMFKQRFSLWGPWSFWGVKGGFHILPAICAPVLWAIGRDRLLMARCFVFCKYRTIYPDPPSTQNLHIIHSYPMVLVLLYLFLEIHGTMVLSHYYPATNYPLLSQYYPISIP